MAGQGSTSGLKRTGAKLKGNLEGAGPRSLPVPAALTQEESPPAWTPREGTTQTQRQQGPGGPPSPSHHGHHMCLCCPPLDTGVTAQQHAGPTQHPRAVTEIAAGPAPRELPRRRSSRTSLSTGPQRRTGERTLTSAGPGGQSQQQGCCQELSGRTELGSAEKGQRPSQNKGSSVDVTHGDV